MQDKETKKTLIYVLVAGMALLVAWEPWRPSPANTSVPERVGTKLFPDFNDPLSAKSLEVMTFNESDATLRDFKVAQQNGVWSIPSHNNYPADAKEHMAKAAIALMDLKILNVVSDRPGDQKIYGVITPDPQKLKVGETGVGTRVTVRNGADKVLADLVIGKPVKDSPNLRYVREAGRDAIYSVAVTTNEFSTKFGDWIEKDLLQLNAFDVREVGINDYSTRSGITREGDFGLALNKRSEIDLAYDDAQNAWSLVEMKEFSPDGQATTVTLTENEELDADKLNALKTALDDLKIIDVERKPSGLSQDLKATEEFAKNREAFLSLQQRGFVPAAAPGEPVQIYSSEGEVTAATKDGVKYILRFGNLAESREGEKPAEGDSADEKKPGDEDEHSGPSRYLFVTAQFDESMIPKPELQPLPGEESAEEKPSTEKAAEEQPAAEEPAAAETPSEPAAEEESVPEEKTAGQESGDSQTAENPANEGEATPADTEQPTEEKAPTASEAERLAIEKENKRRQDEYDSKVKSGQEKVKQLNERFADWYYIISDDTYKKIHLSRKDIVKAKAIDTTDVGNLKDLNQGLGTPAVP